MEDFEPMNFPTAPPRGARDAVDMMDWEQLIRACDAAGKNIVLCSKIFSMHPSTAYIVRDSSGNLITAQILGRPGVNLDEVLYPLQTADASTDDDGLRVRIAYGTIGGKEATGMVVGDADPFYLAASGSGYIYANVVVGDGGTVTSWTALVGGAVPTSTSKTQAYLELASFSTADDGASLLVGPNVTGSQNYQRCRDFYSNPPVYSHIFGVI